MSADSLRAGADMVKMRTGRIFASLMVLFASLQPAAASHGAWQHAPEALDGARFMAQTAQQSNQQAIAPSMALSMALRYSPGSQGLDVALVQGGRMYAVKLKTGNRVHRVLVDARTGQILGE